MPMTNKRKSEKGEMTKTMTDTFYKTGGYTPDHTKFGGLIYPSDFNTEYRGKDNANGSPIASRIENDFRRERRTIHCLTNNTICTL